MATARRGDDATRRDDVTRTRHDDGARDDGARDSGDRDDAARNDAARDDAARRDDAGAVGRPGAGWITSLATRAGAGATSQSRGEARGAAR